MCSSVGVRSAKIIAEPTAVATCFPSAFSNTADDVASVRPRWITRARATRSRPSGATGRMNVTFRSIDAYAVLGGKVDWIELAIALSASMAITPPSTRPSGLHSHSVAGSRNSAEPSATAKGIIPVR